MKLYDFIDVWSMLAVICLKVGFYNKKKKGETFEN